MSLSELHSPHADFPLPLWLIVCRLWFTILFTPAEISQRFIIAQFLVFAGSIVHVHLCCNFVKKKLYSFLLLFFSQLRVTSHFFTQQTGVSTRESGQRKVQNNRSGSHQGETGSGYAIDSTDSGHRSLSSTHPQEQEVAKEWKKRVTRCWSCQHSEGQSAESSQGVKPETDRTGSLCEFIIHPYSSYPALLALLQPVLGYGRVTPWTSL